MTELFLIHEVSPFTIPGSYGSAQEEILCLLRLFCSADVNLQVSTPKTEEALRASSVTLREKEIKKNIPCLKLLNTPDREDESFRKNWERVH